MYMQAANLTNATPLPMSHITHAVSMAKPYITSVPYNAVIIQFFWS